LDVGKWGKSKKGCRPDEKKKKAALKRGLGPGRKPLHRGGGRPKAAKVEAKTVLKGKQSRIKNGAF